NRVNEVVTELVDHRNWGETFHVVEVMNKQMNKAEALEELANDYCIPQHRIDTLGDGSNDLEMIEYAGVGVAKTHELKESNQVAQYVTDTNEDDGVASLLTEYFKTTMHI